MSESSVSWCVRLGQRGSRTLLVVFPSRDRLLRCRGPCARDMLGGLFPVLLQAPSLRVLGYKLRDGDEVVKVWDERKAAGRQHGGHGTSGARRV